MIFEGLEGICSLSHRTHSINVPQTVNSKISEFLTGTQKCLQGDRLKSMHSYDFHTPSVK